MTKKLFVVLSLLVMTMAVMAVPAKKGQWKTLTLSNGKEVKAMLVGDEHGHYWLSADGKAYMEADGTDFFVEIDKTHIQQRANVRRSNVNRQRVQRLATSRRAAVYEGKKKGIILLVSFQDKKFKTADSLELYKRIANEEGFSEGNFKGSMCDYFKAQSYNKFELDFDVYGPYQVSQNYSYYGKNDSQGNDMKAAEMVIEAVKMAKEEVTEWKQYDWDNDGKVDQIYVVYAGQGEADGGASNTIWPHAYTLSSASFYGDGTGPVTVGTNLKVDTYACGSELSGSNSLNGIGTMCHEFSHCLGFPDFYDTDYSGGWGMSYWDLMDAGSYNGDSFCPAGYTSYERWVAGWMEPIVLEDEDVTVEDMKSLQSGGESYILYNKGNRNEYFLLENRQQDGWDAGIPGAGLLILHVDYDAQVWYNNQPNDNPDHQRMSWVPADKKYQYEMYMGEKYVTWSGMKNDPFPYDTTNSFNKSFGTLAKLFNKNKNGTYYLTSSVEDIELSRTGTISFNYVAVYKGSEDSDSTTISPEGALFYESFDKCEGTGGNDDLWSGGIANSDFLPDNEGWTAVSNKHFGANRCAKFGTVAATGSATTPTIALNGTTKMSFKAGAWDSSNDETTLKLSVKGGTVTPATVTMGRGEFNNYIVTVTGSGDVTITFASNKGRFFLDEVIVADPGSTSGIQDVVVRSACGGRVYTLDGRYVGTDIGKLPRGLYIMDGKKVKK